MNESETPQAVSEYFSKLSKKSHERWATASAQERLARTFRASYGKAYKTGGRLKAQEQMLKFMDEKQARRLVKEWGFPWSRAKKA